MDGKLVSIVQHICSFLVLWFNIIRLIIFMKVDMNYSPPNYQFFFKEVNAAFACITEWVHLTPGCEF